jgi:hypothetical protein
MTMGWQSAGHAVSPLCVVRGNVDTNDVILLVTHDQLEGDEVRGHNFCGLDLERFVFWLPEQSNPSLMLARGFCCEYFIPQHRAGVAVVGNFHFQ